MNLIANVERLSKPACFIIGLALVCMVGYVDYVTGYEIAFSLFYLVPIVLVSWCTGWRLGAVTAVVCVEVWLMTDRLSGVVYSNQLIPVWNTLIRLTFFLITVLSLIQKKALDLERSFARTDYCTGALNLRFFRDAAQREIDRSSRNRQPFTAAYIDVDNFKSINDAYGHLQGDEVLRVAAKSMQEELRKTDLVARMGGDEFAILLPAVGPQMAQATISKLRDKLAFEMEKRGWRVTFSIGAVTFTVAPCSVDEILQTTDRLMYTVKNNGKNSISYAEYAEQPHEFQRQTAVDKIPSRGGVQPARRTL